MGESLVKGRISKMSSKGMGVLYHQDRVVLVKNSYIGDEVVVKINESADGVQEAELVEVLSPSEYRVTPFCQYHGPCQGCPWMGLDYRIQLNEKINRVKYAFERINRPEIAQLIKTIHPTSKLEHFRDRCQVKFDGKKLGFVGPDKNVIDIKECKALNPKVQEMFLHLRSIINEERFIPRAGNDWSFIDLDIAMEKEQITPNKKRPFSQAMSEQNQLMKAWVENELRNLGHLDSAIELFAGGGNFSRSLLKNIKKVHAIEFQVESLKKLKEENPELEISALNLYHKKSLFKFWREKNNFDLMLCNPPQEGLKFARSWLDETKVKNLIYISCNVDSFVSDAQQFLKAKFQPLKIEIVDQFPHTPHLEILSNWGKKNTAQ